MLGKIGLVMIVVGVSLLLALLWHAKASHAALHRGDRLVIHDGAGDWPTKEDETPWSVSR